MARFARASVAAVLGLWLAACAGPVIPPPATPPPTPSVVPSLPTPQPTTPIPPVASLTIPGGTPVAGQVGTYSWDGFASDAPWLPGGVPVSVPADILASVRFPPGTEVAGWAVELAPLVDGTAAPEQRSPRSSGSGAEVDFPAPPAGTWSVRLRADFPGHGSVNYFWRFETSP